MAFDASSFDFATLDMTPASVGGDRSGSARILRQKTLKNAISCTGVGLHTGKRIDMTLRPAEAGTGIRFRRTDVPGSDDILAVWSNVKDSRLCTVVGNDQGLTVATIEHLMAALSAQQIDNVLVEVSGPETPVMDGSSSAFVFLIECAGVRELAAARMAYRVLTPVEVEAGAARASLAPASGLTIDFEIEFAAEAIGHQTCSVAVTPESFKQALSRARTFGLIDDLPKMRAAGLGLGGSLENAVVVDGARVLNEDGLRYPDEFVRHKALDAVGDLALAGRPILGQYIGTRSSHALNAALVKALLTRPGAVAEVVMTEADLLPVQEAMPLAMVASA